MKVLAPVLSICQSRNRIQETSIGIYFRSCKVGFYKYLLSVLQNGWVRESGLCLRSKYNKHGRCFRSRPPLFPQETSWWLIVLTPIFAAVSSRDFVRNHQKSWNILSNSYIALSHSCYGRILWCPSLMVNNGPASRYFLFWEKRGQRFSLLQICSFYCGFNKKAMHRNFCCNQITRIRGERYIETIASLDQWSMTIENHWNQWLKDPKTIEKPLKPMVWGLKII